LFPWARNITLITKY